jgi:MSHA pilin protein MshD
MSIKRRQSGLSMIELVIFIVVVGIAVIGVINALAVNLRGSADPMRRKQALAIAEGMLEEVRLARFTFCDAADVAAELPTTLGPGNCNMPEGAGPEAGNSRPYDNVNDYVQSFGTAKAYTTDAAGNAFPSGYTANVNIVAAGGFGPPGAAIAGDATPANMNVLRITVTVNYDNASVVLDSYRTRYAPRSI